MPRVCCDILQYMKSILRFYHNILFIVIYLISVYYRETQCVSIAEGCTFQRIAMRLIVDQSLATGFIPINTHQQRASLPLKPGVLEGRYLTMTIKHSFPY